MASDESSRWDETRCKEGLAHLEYLQNQIDDVRLSIPRILQSLLGNHPTPQDLFWDFRDTVTEIRKGIGRFENSWNDASTQEILEHARQGRRMKVDLRSGGYGGVNGGGGGGVSTTGSRWTGDDFAWREDGDKERDGNDRVGEDGGSVGEGVNGVVESAESGNGNERVMNGVGEEEGSTKSQAQINDAVARLKGAHPDFKIDVDEEHKSINVKYKANSLPMNFTIQYEQENDGRYGFIPRCLGEMKLYPAITKCLTSRPRPHDLNYLLDMVAAYTNVRLTPCAKCGKYINRNGITPAARRPKGTASSESAQQQEWEALHEECL